MLPCDLLVSIVHVQGHRRKRHTGPVGHAMSKVAIVSWREDKLAAELGELAGVGNWHLRESILIVSTSRSVF